MPNLKEDPVCGQPQPPSLRVVSDPHHVQNRRGTSGMSNKLSEEIGELVLCRARERTKLPPCRLGKVRPGSGIPSPNGHGVLAPRTPSSPSDQELYPLG